MKVIIKWTGLPASQQGEKIILMDQLQTGFLKLCTMDFKAFFIIHDVQENSGYLQKGPIKK